MHSHFRHIYIFMGEKNILLTTGLSKSRILVYHTCILQVDFTFIYIEIAAICPNLFVLGGLTFIWVIAWFVLTADTPAQHPRITDAERRHIESLIEYNTHIRVNIQHVACLQVAYNPLIYFLSRYNTIKIHRVVRIIRNKLQQTLEL